MDFTLSDHAIIAIRERSILLEWIERTLSTPSQALSGFDDPSLKHALAVIPEHGDRVLRVIYNATKNPPHVVTVYFDRTMKGKL